MIVQRLLENDDYRWEVYRDEIGRTLWFKVGIPFDEIDMDAEIVDMLLIIDDKGYEDERREE